MVPLFVGNLNGDRLEISVDLKDRRLRLSQRPQRPPKQKSRGQEMAALQHLPPYADVPNHKSMGLLTPSGRNGSSILRPCPADA